VVTHSVWKCYLLCFTKHSQLNFQVDT